ncbi:MAG: TRAP transporter substrate-binding protein [Thermodesulfobacteriota bacterium]|nr:TRAP transporter substrate-binding protein [Thermodesulfobacteriota bacterium]
MLKLKKDFSISSMIFTLFIAIMITGLGHVYVNEADAGTKYKFMMQNMFSLNHPVTQAVNEMAKSIKKDSNGRITIQVLPSGALVKGPNIFETVGNGAIDMGTTCSCYHGGILPVAATAFALPGDPRGVDDIMDFIYKDETMNFLRDAYASTNVRYGAPLIWDGYTIVSKKPIKTWDDLKKLKVRASGSIAKTLRQMKVPTVFIPFSEIYVALSRGTIDAEISGSHTESFLAKTFEVAHYQTIPAISGAQNCEIILNNDKWNSLSEELKTIFEKSLKDCSLRVAQIFNEQDKSSRAKMEAQGAEYIRLPDDVMNKWMQAAIQLWDDELAKESSLSAKYIKLVKKDLKNRGYNL